ncbi:hypothetical protein [Desulfohalovibrio reitneri]|uniref:hypothetical protein n=1 Tax=Desulfohalovibrio reitneri TaxID=1307759 RepID=UPI0004A6FE70|nr:hypothetical protein [Desulfohalovibrio reitneri]
MSRPLVSICAALVLSFLALVPAAAAETVEVEVRAMRHPQEPYENEEAARLLARRKAAALALEASRAAALGEAAERLDEQEKELFAAQRDALLRRANGYVLDLRLVDQETTRTGAVRVTARARVDLGRVTRDAERLRDMERLLESPRVLPEEPVAADPDLRRAARTVLTALHPVLNDVAEVVSSEASPPYLRVQAVPALTDKGLETTLLLAWNEAADPAATLSGVSHLPGGDLRRAALRCAKILEDQARAVIPETWRREMTRPRELTLLASGLAGEDAAKRMAGDLAVIPGVESPRLVRFFQGRGTIRLRYEGTPALLARELALEGFQAARFRADVTRILGETIRLRAGE